MNTIHCLESLPATDGNFLSALKRATEDELNAAIEKMEASTGSHKGRISACKRELRKRNKQER